MSRSMIDDVVKFLNSKKCSVFLRFPFDGALSGNPNEVVTKVLFINYRESTRIKNSDIPTLTNHIDTKLSFEDYEILRRGENNEAYYKIVNKIAHGHGIHGVRKGKPTKEFDLTSFSSKFCGSHNLNMPFWDNIVSQWLMDNGYQHEYRNYPQYVEEIIKLQSDYSLNGFTLREIEFAIWQLCKESNS